MAKNFPEKNIALIPMIMILGIEGLELFKLEPSNASKKMDKWDIKIPHNEKPRKESIISIRLGAVPVMLCRVISNY
jgi:hypothetical protein